MALATSTAYPSSQPASCPSFTLNVGTGPFAISVTPSVDLFLGCKSVPAEVTSLRPPLHVRPDEMTARHDFALLVKISDTAVTDWLADFRSHVISECVQNSSLIGKELTLEALSSIAVKQMGEEGQLGVRVPQDSSPIAPRIQIATEDGTFRTGSVTELATTRILEGAKVVPVVQVAHLWQESVYIGIAPRLLRMRVFPALQNENDGFEAAGF